MNERAKFWLLLGLLIASVALLCAASSVAEHTLLP